MTLNSSVDLIYRAVEEAFGSDQRVSARDLIRHRCGLRHFKAATQETRTVEARELLLESGRAGLRSLVRRYFQDAFEENFRPGHLIIESGMTVDVFGWLDDALILVYIVGEEEYARSRPSKELLLEASIEARVAGEEEYAWLLLVDRSSQDWKSFEIEIEKSVAVTQILLDLEELSVAIESDFVPKGQSSAEDCLSCPFVENCSAPTPWIHLKKGLAFGNVRLSPLPILTKRLDEHLLTLNERRGAVSRISPSQFTASSCDRRIAYGVLGTARKEKVPPKLRRVFNAGHVFHDALQSAMLAAIDDFEEEVPVERADLKIRGTADGLTSKRTFEIKSISLLGFQKLTKPQPKHRQQATIYAVAASKAEIEIIYVNKMTGELLSFVEEVDRDVWHKIAFDIEKVIKSVEAYQKKQGPLPPQLEGKTSTCKSCEYAWVCKPYLESRTLGGTRHG